MSTKPYVMLDAVVQHEKYPKTFSVPSRTDIAALHPGDLVKIIFNKRQTTGPHDIGGERMWVKIEALIDDDEFIGTMANDSVLFPKCLKFGTEVSFKACNITDWLKS